MGNLRKLILIPFDAVLRSLRRRSIVVKLTLFVGLLVALTAGILITVVYYYTGEMLRDQIDNRLSAVADDRQSLLHRTAWPNLKSGSASSRVDTDCSRSSSDMLAERPPEPSPAESDADPRRRASRHRWVCWPSGSRTGRADGRIQRPAGSDRPVRAGRQVPTGVRSRPCTGRLSATCRFRPTPRCFRRRPGPGRRGSSGKLLLVMDVGPIITALADLRRLGETGEVVVGVRDRDDGPLSVPAAALARGDRDSL